MNKVSEEKVHWKKNLHLCEEAKHAPDSLVPLMSTEESGKQNTCFAAKMLVENCFVHDVKQWLRNNENVDDVHPDDSISNVASKHSHPKSTGSGKSSKSGQTIASAHIKLRQKRLHFWLDLQH